MNLPYDISTKLSYAIKLEKAEKSVGKWLNANPRTQAIVVVAMHVMRIIETVGLMHVLPFSFITNCAIAVGSKIIYRLSIERCCNFHFVLPSIFAAAVYGYSKPAIALIVNKKALATFSNFAYASSGITLVLVMSYTITSLAFSEVRDHLLKSDKAPSASPCCQST